MELSTTNKITRNIVKSTDVNWCNPCYKNVMCSAKWSHDFEPSLKKVDITQLLVITSW